MMLKLAFRNILGAGLRTWLNVIILSLGYFGIIAMQGIYIGWQEEATKQTKDWDIAGGQYWQTDYDPFDPFVLDKSHSVIPDKLVEKIKEKKAIPILITSAVIYPEGRMKNILLKGIDPNQTLLSLPTKYLKEDAKNVAAIIGARMAKSSKLKVGDFITVRWRDKNGTFDAIDIKITNIFNTTVISVDSNQLWIPIKTLQKMLELSNEATIITLKKEVSKFPDWDFKSTDFLLRDLNQMIKIKEIGSSIMYVILLFMGIIAIFDTQVLSIFKRRKEIGTLIALGMTRKKLIVLFTLEGLLHAILAIFVGAIYGIPLLHHLSKAGIKMVVSADEMGLSGISDYMYPHYGIELILGTIILILFTVAIVSYIPARKISRLNPTDALRGKITR